MKNILKALYNRTQEIKAHCNINTLLIVILITWNIILTAHQLEPKQPKTPPADLPAPVYIIKDLEPEDLR